MKFQIGMRFSCEKNLPEAKWISVNSLDIAFNEHVRLKLIAVILTEMKFAYACPSKYQVVLKCRWNETSCQQNFFHTGLKSQSGISSFQGCSALKINRRAITIASNIWLNNWCLLRFYSLIWTLSLGTRTGIPTLKNP